MSACELFSFAENCDIPNWLALFIEILLGSSLAAVFFIKQQKQSVKVQKIIDEQENFRRKRIDWAIANLTSNLPELKERLNELSDNVLRYTEIPKGIPLSETFDTLIEANDLMREHYVNKIEKVIDQSIGVLDPTILNELQDILQIAEKNSRIVTEKNIEIKSIAYKKIIPSIDSLLNKLNNLQI